MKEIFTTGVLILCALIVIPQKQQLPPDLLSLVEAERAFARSSVERGVRDAFLAFFAADGVAFLPHPINGIKAYGSLPVQTAQPEFTLNWAPIYGDVSAAGDLGYSTGPVINSDNTAQKRPARYSLFFSIWKKQANGDWRVVLDLGVQLDRAYAPLDTPYQRAPQVKSKVPKGEAHVASLLKAEREFFKNTASARVRQKFWHKDARVYRNGRQPLSGEDWLAMPVVPLTGEPLKTDVARSGELGYSYGRYQSAGQEKGYYAHVWKRDAAGQWRLVFDVAKALPDEPKHSTDVDSLRRSEHVESRSTAGR